MRSLEYVQAGRLISDAEYCHRMKEYREGENLPLTEAERDALDRTDIEAFEKAALDVSWGEYVAANMEWPDTFV